MAIWVAKAKLEGVDGREPARLAGIVAGFEQFLNFCCNLEGHAFNSNVGSLERMESSAL